MNIVFISVVRDFKMYNSLVKENRFNQGAEFVSFDNNKENISITKRYNSFLDLYDYSKPAWFIFCHEDWETEEKWLDKLSKLDKNSLYGFCGTKIIQKNTRLLQRYLLGEIKCSDKRGQRESFLGIKVKTGTIVDTFDCMSMVVHSSLIQKHHLRFDENLTWHQYIEEFCIRVKEDFKISSRILQIKCHHWSWGRANKELEKSFEYIKNKFKNSKFVYSCTCLFCAMGRNNLPLDCYDLEKYRVKLLKLFGFSVCKIKNSLMKTELKKKG